MYQEKMATVDNLLKVESREVRVLSADETAQVGGAFIACTLATESSAGTSLTPELTTTSMICILA